MIQFSFLLKQKDLVENLATAKNKERVRQIWVDAKGFELVYGTKSVLGKVKVDAID